MNRQKLRARLNRVREGLEKERVDALLVTDLKNIRYLSGFTGSNAYMVLPVDGRGFFLTDPRYTQQAKEEVRCLSVRIFKKALDAVSGLVRELKIKSLGFEAGSLSYENYTKIRKAVPKVRLKAASGIINRARRIKDASEIELIRESARVLDTGFKAAQRIIRPGVVEKEAAFSIEAAMRRRGADGLAFDTIIASGFRGALPHGKASSKKVKKGELVVVDMGVVMNGYNSDETRTFVTGRPTPEQRKVYRTVLEAQQKAIDAIRPGVRASEVDMAARGHIVSAGYGRRFSHGTGHGVGLEIHEGPALGPTSDEVLEEGMVVTVEPGIYIPGWGGVRIEDMALVVKGGCEILTRTPKDLIQTY